MTKSPLPKDVRELADWLQKNFNMSPAGAMGVADTLLLFRQSQYPWLVSGLARGTTPGHAAVFVGHAAVFVLRVATIPNPWYPNILVYKVGAVLCLGEKATLDLRQMLAHSHPDFYQWTPTDEQWWEILRKPPKDEPALIALTI